MPVDVGAITQAVAGLGSAISGSVAQVSVAKAEAGARTAEARSAVDIAKEARGGLAQQTNLGLLSFLQGKSTAKGSNKQLIIIGVVVVVIVIGFVVYKILSSKSSE